MQQIFVHGLGQMPSSWDKTIENLKINSNCNCPDLSEMLQSKEANYANLYTTFSEYCDKVSEPIAICGLSLGAILALHYGIEHPNKIKSLALNSSTIQNAKAPIGITKYYFSFYV